MKISFARHGGLAAGVHLGRPPKTIDADRLPQEAASELSRLLTAAAAAKAPAGNTSRAADAMSYTVTVDDGGQSTVLRQSDATMSPAFAALLDWLDAHADKG